jgi:hypothetical protein
MALDIACTLPSPLCTIAANKDFFASVGTLVVVLTAAIGLGTFIFGFIQYQTNQRWKRNEFLAKEIHDFLCDKCVIDVLKMLDYTGGTIYEDENGVEIGIRVYHGVDNLKNPVKVGSEFIVDLGNALHYHGDGVVYPAEEIIRDRFDIYFDYLTRFSVFMTNKLFTKAEIFPYIEYHLQLLGGMRNHSAGYHEALYTYVILYDFNRVIAFLDQFERASFIQPYIDQAQRRKVELLAQPISEDAVAEYRDRIFQVVSEAQARTSLESGEEDK